MRTGTIAVRAKSDSVLEEHESQTDAVPTAPGRGEPQESHADNHTDKADDVAEYPDSCSGAVDTDDTDEVTPQDRARRITWPRVTAFGVLPILALLIAVGASYLKWDDAWNRGVGAAGNESVAAAKESTVAILSYQTDSVEKDLGAARDRLTGKFKDAYTQLVHDVVIPGAKKDHVSAIATVPAAASVSANPNHAVALLFVNQTVTIGNDAPTDAASTVRVTLEKIGGGWLISAFDPV